MRLFRFGEAAEGGGELGGVRLAFDRIGTAAEKGGFGDNELVGADIPEELGVVANLDGFGGGDVALNLATDDDLGCVDFGLDHGFRANGQGALGDNFAFKGAVELEGAIKGEGAFDFDLIRDQGGATGRFDAGSTHLGGLRITEGCLEGICFTAILFPLVKYK